MRILIDCSNLQVGGGIQVATSFINDLNDLNVSLSIAVLLSPQMKASFFRESFSSNFQFIDTETKYYKNIITRSKYIREVEDKIQPAIIFTVFGPSYHKSKFTRVVGFAIPHLIYSGSPFFKSLGLIERLKMKAFMKIKQLFFVKNSDALIFETNDSRDIFVKNFKFVKPTYVVNNTLNQIFINEAKWLPLDFKADPSFSYILCLTANYPHKNLQIIPAVIDAMLKNNKSLKFKFVLSIGKQDVNFSDHYNEYISYIGRVELEKIPTLYNKIDILFMPSLLEVFSTSYLEAMYMKKPIVASDMSFARDVCGEAAVYCPPMDAVSYANAIAKIILDKDFKNELVEKGNTNFKRFGTSIERTKAYLDILTKESYYNNENTK